jgi:hypothetical protein
MKLCARTFCDMLSDSCHTQVSIHLCAETWVQRDSLIAGTSNFQCDIIHLRPQHNSLCLHALLQMHAPKQDHYVPLMQITYYRLSLTTLARDYHNRHLSQPVYRENGLRLFRARSGHSLAVARLGSFSPESGLFRARFGPSRARFCSKLVRLGPIVARPQETI